jgi:hypothetical protein
MFDDVRDGYDPLTEVPGWFWDRIAAAQADPAFFGKLGDQELIDFANEMDLKTYFSHAPFHPPPEVYVSENTLDEAGAWVISQGKGFFQRVWHEPQLFWSVITERRYGEGWNFEFSAHHAWDERHGTDIPKI